MNNFDCSPVPWQEYFGSSSTVTLGDSDRFRVFLASTDPQASLSGDAPRTVPKRAFVCHHGAGHSALSWAVMARALLAQAATEADHCDVVAFDARGHGETQCADETLSLEQLGADMAGIIRKVYPGKLPSELVLAGHSVVHDKLLPFGAVLGVAVLDVVEGTAVESLSSMRHYLAARPSSFASMDDAIRWSVETGTIRNRESARVSVPGQLVQRSGTQRFFWRTNLWATEPQWQKWFQGLSAKFLACRAAKVLVLAGTDRLDKDLTIGQMQGKFQMVVLPACGHAVQEDDAVQTASTLLEFLRRNKRLVLPPKVGENGFGLGVQQQQQ
ncbi:Protein phosphatase methylesterase 1 [Sorochytrium milnesiophthora]